MAGYVIIVSDITDEALFAEFLERVGATVEAHGGRYLVRGGAIEIADGDWAPDRLVVIELTASSRRGDGSTHRSTLRSRAFAQGLPALVSSLRRACSPVVACDITRKAATSD